MSKIFFDHLVVFEKIDLEIKNAAKVPEEKEELWQIVDEIVQHHVLICILEELPREHHEDFLDKFHSHPYDSGLIRYLNKKTNSDIEEIIREKVKSLEKEILEDISSSLT
jgi:hypothetical protein